MRGERIAPAVSGTICGFSHAGDLLVIDLIGHAYHVEVRSRATGELLREVRTITMEGDPPSIGTSVAAATIELTAEARTLEVFSLETGEMKRRIRSLPLSRTTVS